MVLMKPTVGRSQCSFVYVSKITYIRCCTSLMVLMKPTVGRSQCSFVRLKNNLYKVLYIAHGPHETHCWTVAMFVLYVSKITYIRCCTSLMVLVKPTVGRSQCSFVRLKNNLYKVLHIAHGPHETHCWTVAMFVLYVSKITYIRCCTSLMVLVKPTVGRSQCSFVRLKNNFYKVLHIAHGPHETTVGRSQCSFVRLKNKLYKVLHIAHGPHETHCLTVAMFVCTSQK